MPFSLDLSVKEMLPVEFSSLVNVLYRFFYLFSMVCTFKAFNIFISKCYLINRLGRNILALAAV